MAPGIVADDPAAALNPQDGDATDPKKPTTTASVSVSTTPELSPYHASSTDAAIASEARHAAHNYHPLPIVCARAAGVKVWDPEGREYLDFLSAYSAVNQGHCHPALVKALTDQAARLTLSSRAFYNDVFPRFAEFVTAFFGYDMVLPMNTGAEAVETAVKVARKWAYKVKGVKPDEALVFSAAENFHGRTMTAISLSTDPESRDNYGPYVPNIGPVCPSTGRTIKYDDIPSLRAALEAHGDRTAAFIVEPIQGEAGIVVPRDDYLREVRRLCTQHRVLFVCDEIQTGIARTGKLLCNEWSLGPSGSGSATTGSGSTANANANADADANANGASDSSHGHGCGKPDLVLLGKAISGGMYPVSCVLGSREALLTVEPGTHGSTYGGNPLGCAVAMRALELVRDEDLVARAERLGRVFREGLEALKKECPLISIVRGKGLLNAIVIDESKTGGHSAWDLCMLMKEKGILAKPTHQNIIRLAPPLVITEEQIQFALRVIKETLEEIPNMKKNGGQSNGH